MLEDSTTLIFGLVIGGMVGIILALTVPPSMFPTGVDMFIGFATTIIVALSAAVWWDGKTSQHSPKDDT